MKRVLFDLTLLLITGALFYFKDYEGLSAPIQLMILKAALVSAGVLHAHIVRKIIFPKVNWNGTMTPSVYAAISFYTIIPLCYAFGG